jgi:hypothetical protein
MAGVPCQLLAQPPQPLDLGLQRRNPVAYVLLLAIV